MVAANPPPQTRIPDNIAAPGVLKQFLVDLQNDVYRLWLRSGGGKDVVGELDVDLSIIEARLDAVEGRLDTVEDRVTALEGTFIVTAVNVTTSGNTTILCKAAVTVTLDANPSDKDRATIKAKVQPVTISGNGRNIDLHPNIILRRTSILFIPSLTVIYSSEEDQWFIGY